MGRTTVISSTNNVRRLKASTRYHLASDRLRLVRVTSSVMHLTNLLCLPRMFTNIPLICIGRHAFLIRANEVVVWLTRRAVEVNEVKGGNEAIHEDILTRSGVNTNRHVHRNYRGGRSRGDRSFAFRASGLWYCWVFRSLPCGFGLSNNAITATVHRHRLRRVLTTFLRVFQIRLTRRIAASKVKLSGRNVLPIGHAPVNVSTNFLILNLRSSFSHASPLNLI